MTLLEGIVLTTAKLIYASRVVLRVSMNRIGNVLHDPKIGLVPATYFPF